MEWISWIYVLWSALMSSMTLLWLLKPRNSFSFNQLPPGPKGWPLFGNIFDLGSLPHRSLAAMKQTYGPVVWLNLGSVSAMVIQSAAAAEEFFRNHDLSFIDRTTVEVTNSHDYYKSSLALASYNNYWRTLRRICAVELFTNNRLNEAVLIRRKCVDDMLAWIGNEVDKGASGGIMVRQFVLPAMFNLTGNLTLSCDLVNPHSEIVPEFFTALSGFEECVGTPNVSDLFPWLTWLDLQGLRRKTDRDLGRAIEIITGFVNERVKQQQQKEGRSSFEQRKDFLDVLLDFIGRGNDEPAKLSDREISIFLLEMFAGGTGTTSSSIEWAMCELLQNPETMVKIKAELGRVMGANTTLEESDITNLHYLRATVEETLRLHPPVPLLIPRKAIRDANFMGYNIPKGTQVLVNVWGIGRDEESWEDASSFRPERFLDSNIRYNGQHFQFLPFGAGRRICPGLSLGHRVLPLILGSLLHHFEWKLCEGEMTVDMTETIGTAARKLQPLKAIPKRIPT